MMSNELIRQLEEAGFFVLYVNGQPITPLLSDLIKACGENFGTLSQHVERKLWEATSKIEKDKPSVRGIGNTPEEAVASMYVAWINGIKP